MNQNDFKTKIVTFKYHSLRVDIDTCSASCSVVQFSTICKCQQQLSEVLYLHSVKTSIQQFLHWIWSPKQSQH